MNCFSYSSGVQRSKMDSTGLKLRCSFWRLLGRIRFLVYSSIYRLPSFLGLWPPSSNHVTPSAASVIPHSSDSHPPAPGFKNPWDYIQSNRSCAQSCLTLGDPMDYNPPGSSVHGVFQSRSGATCHFLLQGIFLTQGLNLSLLHLLHCRRVLYLLSQHWDHPNTQGKSPWYVS